MFAAMMLFLGGCSLNDGPIYFESGTYVIVEEEYVEDTAFESDDNETEQDFSEERETFALVVDLEQLTAEITGTSFDTTLTLKERPQKDWEFTCPMQMVATDVQTVDIADSFDLWTESHQGAYIYAYDCHGEPRTSDEIMLSRSTGSTILFLTKQ